jgi:hypothetical protein
MKEVAMTKPEEAMYLMRRLRELSAELSITQQRLADIRYAMGSPDDATIERAVENGTEIGGARPTWDKRSRY